MIGQSLETLVGANYKNINLIIFVCLSQLSVNGLWYFETPIFHDLWIEQLKVWPLGLDFLDIVHELFEDGMSHVYRRANEILCG